mmetsp:Transcript_63049/g.144475  ORF Transcript_63049/g.144475 Transcript_63049/m.144475 type:complete len:205 (-) Transcript_63049:17-631(-)
MRGAKSGFPIAVGTFGRVPRSGTQWSGDLGGGVLAVRSQPRHGRRRWRGHLVERPDGEGGQAHDGGGSRGGLRTGVLSRWFLPFQRHCGGDNFCMGHYNGGDAPADARRQPGRGEIAAVLPHGQQSARERGRRGSCALGRSATRDGAHQRGAGQARGVFARRTHARHCEWPGSARRALGRCGDGGGAGAGRGAPASCVLRRFFG